MELIAENGNQKTTISMVAKHAGVSSGYLYTHFESKEALIDELIHDTYLDVLAKLVKIGESNKSIELMISDFLMSLMNLANEDSIKAKFLTSLAHDARFIKEFVLEDPHGVFEIAEKVLILGKREKIFRADLIAEELLLVFLNLPISSIYYNLIVDKGDGFYSEMQHKIVRLCLNALK
jgi:AcrR family transcriptional regulator